AWTVRDHLLTLGLNYCFDFFYRIVILGVVGMPEYLGLEQRSQIFTIRSDNFGNVGPVQPNRSPVDQKFSTTKTVKAWTGSSAKTDEQTYVKSKKSVYARSARQYMIWVKNHVLPQKNHTCGRWISKGDWPLPTSLGIGQSRSGPESFGRTNRRLNWERKVIEYGFGTQRKKSTSLRIFKSIIDQADD
ncbi:hypothetical protein O181_124549, partial [Austropuccinia psidii MF-1]|nr:hypothetical protein [Austropuccinia psidii MF-1]